MNPPIANPSLRVTRKWRSTARREAQLPASSNGWRDELIKGLADTLNSSPDQVWETTESLLSDSVNSMDRGRLTDVPISDDFSLRAEIHHAYGESRGTIVFVHGFCGNRHENGLFQKLAQAVANVGFDAVLYDWRGIGDSDGVFATATLEDHVQDFLGITDWVREECSSDRVSTVAFSLGAAVVGSALIDRESKDRADLSSAIYLSPAVRPKESMLPRYTKTLDEIKQNGAATKPGTTVELGLAAIQSLEADLGEGAFDLDIPLFVCHGTNDSRIQPEHTKRLLETASITPKHYFFAGASHSFRPDGTYWDILGAATSIWFDQSMHYTKGQPLRFRSAASADRRTTAP